MKTIALLLAALACLAGSQVLAAGPDIVLADFEGKDYGAWKATGTAFGTHPARGTLPGQMQVSGYLGRGLVNSFNGGDRATGTLTSPEFTINRAYLTFLIGGGGWAGKTCMNLLVDGKMVRTAAGPNTLPGGSESLEQGCWEVADLAGKPARIEIVDSATGGWGHINVDQIVLSDSKPPRVLKEVKRDIVIGKRYLNLPIKTGERKRSVQLLVDGRPEVRLDVELANGDPEWWAFVDATAWRGKTVTIIVDKLPEDSRALTQVDQTDTIKGAETLYSEPLRPQLHFSSRRGWNNDPNGMVFFRGEYHLFYQHNPYGWAWGNMHWGHAVSRNLVHWQELGDVLAPDDLGPMFSGSAVVDVKNSSGLGSPEQPPQVLIYTAAGHPTVQCIASSTDGRNYTKYAGNPVVKEITGGNRDPKVYWHAPTGKWVMALYVGLPGKDKTKLDKNGRPAVEHTIQFLTSPNLKDWTVVSQIEGFYECPDFFELPIDGNAQKTKWVVTAASSEYVLGQFDGVRFTPEGPKLKGHLGRGFYAAQTFADMPASDGRRIQIGWLQAPSPGMPFNQAMSLPLELTLRSTPQGPRLAWNPVKELESLRKQSHRPGTTTLKPGDANPLAGIEDELLEARAEFTPSDTAEVAFTIRGIAVVYDARKQEISVNGHRAPAPLSGGKQSLTIYADRTALEVFASGGLCYVPMPVIPKADQRGAEVTVRQGTAQFSRLELHTLKSIWAK